MTSRLECVQAEELAQYLRGKLATDQARTVEDHLTTCESCLGLLRKLEAADPFYAALQTPVANEGTLISSPELVGFQDQLKALADAPAKASASGESDTAKSLAPHGQSTEMGGPAPTLGHAAKNLDQPQPPHVVPTIPGYEILDELGGGGMGVVYRARQIQLNRIVALKMIKTGAHADVQEAKRFLQEAELIARLKHPHIVQVYEFGSHQGMPFFSLDFHEGGSLAMKLHGEPQPPWEAAELVETLARAVQAAHEQGIIHRDLKPANVLLTANGIPRITDFGLAKQLQASDAQTQTGAILGTPSYMAPEQAEGKTRAIGIATDVYALGAILYEMLTGRPPFKGVSEWDTVRLVIETEPVPPSRFHPRLPRDLETICLKCLQKDPRRRYGRAADLADDLSRFREGRPILARRMGIIERGWRWSWRNRARVAVAAAVFALTSTVLWSLVRWDSAKREHRAMLLHDSETDEINGLAELRRSNFPGAEKFFDQAVTRLAAEPSLTEVRARLEKRHDQAQRLNTFYKLSEKSRRMLAEGNARDLFGKGIDVEPGRLCEEGLRAVGVFTHDPWWEGLPDAELDPLQWENLREEVYRQLLFLATIRGQAGLKNFGAREAAPAYEACLKVLALAKQFRPEACAVNFLEFGCLLGLQKYAKALTLPTKQPNGASDYFYLGMLHVWLSYYKTDAVALVLVGQLARSRQLELDKDRALDTAEKYLRLAASLEPDYYYTYYWLAICTGLKKDFKTAELAAAAAIALRPDYAYAYVDRGTLYAILIKDYDKAYKDCCKAIQLQPDLAIAYVHRGAIQGRKGNYEMAIADFTQAIRLDPEYARAYASRAFAYGKKEMYNEAMADFAVAIRLIPDDREFLKGRAMLYHQQKEYVKAIVDLTTAIRAEPKDAVARGMRGQVHAASGTYRAAVADLTEAARLDEAAENWERAASHLSELASLSPWDAAPRLRAGQLWARAGKPHQAALNFLWAAWLDPRRDEKALSSRVGSTK